MAVAFCRYFYTSIDVFVIATKQNAIDHLGYSLLIHSEEQSASDCDKISNKLTDLKSDEKSSYESNNPQFCNLKSCLISYRFLEKCTLALNQVQERTYSFYFSALCLRKENFKSDNSSSVTNQTMYNLWLNFFHLLPFFHKINVCKLEIHIDTC